MNNNKQLDRIITVVICLLTAVFIARVLWGAI